jgi:inhibitor of cysteine peptidase
MTENKMGMFIFSLFTLMLSFSVAVNAAIKNGKVTSIYTEKEPNIVIEAQRPQFTIKLKSNPSTGYSWLLRDYNTALIEPIGHRFEAGNKKLMGVSGFELWDFRVKPAAFAVPHHMIIRLNYARPWTNKDSTTQMVFYIATVKNAKKSSVVSAEESK